MNFDKVWAHPTVKEYLQESIKENRISHAQLFIGKPGWGTLDMALAYAEKILTEGRPESAQKVKNLTHPDLHFSVPTFKLDKKDAISKNYLGAFQSLVSENHFADISQWYELLDAGNKQGFLSKNEIDEVVKSLSLKSYEGGYKVLIIWNADKMKTEYANKFLKLLEEPPERTLFLLLTEKPENMLDTISSRCVSVNFKPLTDEQIRQYANQELGLEWEGAVDSFLGDIQKVQSLAKVDENRVLFESEFVAWTRNAFRAYKKTYLLKDIIEQAEKIASWQTEMQKQYLSFCMETFRSALMNNYQANELSFSEIEKDDFRYDAFVTFVSGDNIQEILEQLNQTYYYIERNANKKLAFTNLGIKLTRLIQKK